MRVYVSLQTRPSFTLTLCGSNLFTGQIDSLTQRFAWLECGTRAAGISTGATLRGLRPIREARWMTQKLPKPLISMRCPRTIALFIASKMVETAVSASPCVS